MVRLPKGCREISPRNGILGGDLGEKGWSLVGRGREPHVREFERDLRLGLGSGWVSRADGSASDGNRSGNCGRFVPPVPRRTESSLAAQRSS